VKLTLSGTIAKGDDYRLKVVRQPTVNLDNIDVTVVGRSWVEGGRKWRKGDNRARQDDRFADAI